MEGPGFRGGNKRKGNGRALHTGEFLLGLFGRLGEALQGLAVAAQVDLVLGQEGIGQPIDDAPIPIVAAQLGITAGGLDVKDAIGDPQHRHIEGAATQVEHQHPFDGTAIEAVGQGSGSGFVEDAFNADASQAPGIAGGLALGVVEIGRHGDHRRLHRLPEVGGRVINQLAQQAGHQLLGGVFPFRGRADHPHVALVVGPDRVGHGQAALFQFIPTPADVALEVGKGIAGVEHQLAAGQLAHQQFLVPVKAEHRGRGTPPLGTSDHLGTAALQHRHHGVGGAQVDANDPPHGSAHGMPKLTARKPWSQPKRPSC